jgi:hypothetical protein
MPPDPAVEIAEGGRGFVPADDKHVDLLAVRELVAADRARHGKVGGSPYQRVGCVNSRRTATKARNVSAQCGSRARQQEVVLVR